MKEINVYYLTYCKHCTDLKEGLEKECIKFNALDADDYLDESKELEELLSTDTYPIIEVKADSEVVYFVSGDERSQIADGVYKEPYTTISSLIYQIKNL